MEEKKLTDEEIVNDIERSTCMPSYWKKIVLDLIYRLQDEKQKVVQDYYCEAQHCDVQKDIIEKQKAEIEKLLCKNAELEVRCEGILKDYYAECQTCDEQKDEIKRLKEKSISPYRDSWKNKFFKAQEAIERLTEELKYYRGELQ